MKILLTKSIVALLLLLPCLTLQAQTYSKITYIHSDADGTPFAATDEQGNLAWQLDHYPYGDEYRNTSDERANDTSFAGKAYDSEIGLSYFGSRWYDPAIGRFTSIDPRPITPEDYRTFNRYAYGFNNPYKYVDPDGRFAFLIPVVIWAGKTLTITGAGLSGYAVGSNGYDLYSGRKSAGEAARDAAIDVGIALTLKGAGGGLLKAGERFGESIGNATKGGDTKIFRQGTSKESPTRLNRKAQEAENSDIGIHGVSGSTTKTPGCSSASCSDLEAAGFKVHKTPTRRDKNHVTIELPKPITKSDAIDFNNVLGR